MKYRSRVDIIASLLQSASHGATKARLMYDAYLSYSQFREYLGFLQERELIVREDNGRLYRLTDRGMRFLQVYQELSDLIKIEDNRKLRHLQASLMAPIQR